MSNGNRKEHEMKAKAKKVWYAVVHGASIVGFAPSKGLAVKAKRAYPGAAIVVRAEDAERYVAGVLARREGRA